MRVRVGALAILLAVVLSAACSDDRAPPGGGPTGVGGGSGAGGSGASGGQGGAGGSLADVCERTCTTKGELGCTDFDYDTCWGECFSAPLIMPWCAVEAEVWVRCAGPQPVSYFTCNPEPGKQPVLVQGVCADELADLFSCWFEGPAEGLPDLSADCATMCAAQSGLACYSASCETDCIASIAEPIECNGARAGVVYCLAAQSDPAYICGVANAPELVGDGCEFYDEIIYGCENM